MTKSISEQPPQWMVVYTTFNSPEAHIVAGRLKSEGIPALVHQAPGASAIGIHIGSLGEVTVLVREEDYWKAIEILEPDSPALLPDSDEDIIDIEFDEAEDDE
jgi:hypothetical protein